jgi:hypothetical protein
VPSISLHEVRCDADRPACDATMLATKSYGVACFHALHKANIIYRQNVACYLMQPHINLETNTHRPSQLRLPVYTAAANLLAIS